MLSSVVFFFDIDALNKTCASHGLQFADRAYVLPSFKCLRIFGVKSKDAKGKQKQREKDAKGKQKQSAILKSGTTVTKDIDYDKNIEQIDDSKEALTRRLKDARQKLNTFLIETKSANQLKKEWNIEGSDRVQLYQQIQETKIKKED